MKLMSDRPQLNWNYRLEKAALPIFIGGFLFVAIATLFPFDFYLPDRFSLANLLDSFHLAPSRQTAFKDLVENLILFLPLGFGASGLLAKTQLNPRIQLSLILICSAFFSSTIETLQAFLPSRHPTGTDILTNTIGSGLGYFTFCHWRFQLAQAIARILRRIRRGSTVKNLTFIYWVYFLIILIISSAVQTTTNLSNWNTDYPLIIGNEATGDRPWKGSISQLAIADRLLSEPEINILFQKESKFSLNSSSWLISYQFDRPNPWESRNKILLPFLTQEESLKPEKNGVLNLNRDRWLQTKGSAKNLITILRQQHQFSLILTLATLEDLQSGPARIVSLSKTPFERNLTLGQEENDLVFRLRTPITGRNGMNPEFVVPNFFSDRQFHRLLIAYDGANLAFYRDRPTPFSEIRLTPDFILFRYLLLNFEESVLRLDAPNAIVYCIFYYSVVFIPLGSLAAIIGYLLSRDRPWIARLLIVFGTILPGFLLELLLSRIRGTAMAGDRLLWSWAIASLAVVGVMRYVKSRSLKAH
jgi:VanZ family protein